MTMSEVDRKLVMMIVRQVLVPALATAPMTEEALAILHHELAGYLREVKQASVSTVARHLEMSRRWVSLVSNTSPDDLSRGGWYGDIMSILLSRFPEVLTVAQVRTGLKGMGREVGQEALRGQLDVYVRLEILEKVGQRYRARNFVDDNQRLQHENNIDVLETRLRALYSICRSFGRAERGAIFGSLHGQMDEECFVGFTAEIQEMTGKLAHKYAQISEAREQSGDARMITFSAIIAIGRVPETS